MSWGPSVHHVSLVIASRARSLIRGLLPGHAGARNCKYLECVTVTDTPCDGHSNWKQYTVHAPDVVMRKIAEFEKYKKASLVLALPTSTQP